MHTTWRDLHVGLDAWTAFVSVFVMHFLARNSWHGAIEFGALLFVVLLLTSAIVAVVRGRRAATAEQIHTRKGM